MRDSPENGSRLHQALVMLGRPFPLRARLVLPAVTMMLLVPGYLVIGEMARGRVLHQPASLLDRLVPVVPAWTPVYLSYLAVPFLPVLIMRSEEQLRRTFLAWLTVWLAGYACFLAYPTVLPRPMAELGGGFFAWFLRGIYDADAPRNCLPSLHVATPLVAALSCWRVHRGVGLAAGVWTVLIALSTLFTKQHYVADVLGGAGLALVGWALFLRRSPEGLLPLPDRRAAPVLLAGLLGLCVLILAGLWVVYRFG